MTKRWWIYAAILGALPLASYAWAASQVNNFSYSYVSAAWMNQSPDGMIIFTVGEAMHAKAVQFVVSHPGVGNIGLYAVKDGTPCRDPTSNAINGVSLLAAGSFGDVAGSMGKRQVLAMASVANTALAAGSSICVDDLTSAGDYSGSRATVTIDLAP